MMQNFLLIGAFVILGILSLAINNTIFLTTTSIAESEIQITGIGLAQALMEEIISRDFDEHTTGSKRVASPQQLTSVNELGPDSGEPPYDDVDDYNNFTQNIDTPRIDGYEMSVKVGYASPSSPKNFVSLRTFLKRIEITVKNKKYMDHPDSLKLVMVVSYFK